MASIRRFTDSSDDPSRERANASPHTGISGHRVLAWAAGRR
jgi:hypothetical protein